MLLNRRHGSFFFLSAILTDVDLAADALPHGTAHCGTCTATSTPARRAPSEPYVLDARKCISYLTIELKDDPVPVPLREGMGSGSLAATSARRCVPGTARPRGPAEPVFALAGGDAAGRTDAAPGALEEEFAREFGRTPLSATGAAGDRFGDAAIAAREPKAVSAVPLLRNDLFPIRNCWCGRRPRGRSGQIEGTADTSRRCGPGFRSRSAGA